MKNSTIILIAIAIILLGIGGWFYYNYSKYTPATYVQESTDSDGTSTATTVNTETGTTTPGATGYAMSDVAAHKDASSCYTVISGKVYDLTMWVNLHPGGKAAILSICGIDGTKKFTEQHHSGQLQMNILARYYIGNLQ